MVHKSITLMSCLTFEAIPPVTSVPREFPSALWMEARLAGVISSTMVPSVPRTPSVSPASSSHLLVA